MTKDQLRRQIASVLERHPQRRKIAKVLLFGSHVHGTARKDSDVDLLIEFSTPVGYFTLMHLQSDIAASIGKPVDLVTVRGLSEHLRSSVLASAETVYEQE